MSKNIQNSQLSLKTMSFMKKSLLLVALFAFACTFQADAQMTVKKFGVSLGQDWDMLPGLSTDMLLRKTDSRTAGDIQPFLNSANSYSSSGFCENQNFRLTLVLEPQRWKNVELHTSGVFIFNRMDGVHFYDSNENGYSNLDFTLHGNEVDVEAVLLKKVPVFGFLDRQFLNLYGGIGTNFGYQFGNYMSVSSYSSIRPERDNGTWEYEHNSSYDNINDGVSARVFAQAGFGITFFKRVELGFEARYGAGFRHYFATDTDFTNLHSTAFNLKYLLGSRLSRAERELKRAERAEKARCTWDGYKRCQG